MSYELTTIDDMNRVTGRAVSDDLADLTQAADGFERMGHRIMLCEFASGRVLRLSPLN